MRSNKVLQCAVVGLLALAGFMGLETVGPGSTVSAETADPAIALVRRLQVGTDRLRSRLAALREAAARTVASADGAQVPAELRESVVATFADIKDELRHIAPLQTELLEAYVVQLAEGELPAADVAALVSAGQQSLQSISADLAEYSRVGTVVVVDGSRKLTPGRRKTVAIYVRNAPPSGFAAFDLEVRFDPRAVNVTGVRLLQGQGTAAVEGGRAVLNGIAVGQVATSQVAGDVMLLGAIDVVPRQSGEVAFDLSARLFDGKGRPLAALPLGARLEVK